MFFPKDGDNDDIIPQPSNRSNLSTIFAHSSGDGHSRLIYVAPKQPKAVPNSTKLNSTASTSSSTNTVVIAKTVQTFRMIEGEYNSQGRLGAAVICVNSVEGLFYHLLLYRDTHHQVAIATIKKDFNFHVQPKNYCTYYDKLNVVWSILFANKLELVEFAMEVALARWKVDDTMPSMIVQDLWCPTSVSESKSTAAVAGDTVELTYTMRPFTTTNQVVEENYSICVELKNSGWTKGLLGVHPTSQRVILLQNFLMDKELNPKDIVFDGPVAVKITVVQVKKPSAKEPNPPQPQLKVDIQSETNKTIKPTTTVQESPAGVEEARAISSEPERSEGPRGSPKPTKADLITRMARMGQALPFKVSGPTPSDSDETEQEDRPGLVRGSDRAVPKPRSRVHHTTALAQAQPTTPPTVQSLTSAPVSQTLPQQWAAAPYVVSNVYSAGPQLQSPVALDSHFNIFLSEVRTTNSELRMGLTRLTDKVEHLQTKLDRSDGRSDSGVLEQILENEKQLKEQIQLVLTAIQENKDSGGSNVQSPPNVSATFLPSDSVTHPSTTERLEKLKEENEYLVTTLNAQRDALQNAKIVDKDQLSRINDLQSRLREEEMRVSDLNQRLHNMEEEKKTINDNLEATRKSVTELQVTLQEKQTNIDKLEQALKDSEATHLEEVRRKLQEVMDPKPVIAEHVKKILNAVYRLVKVQFEPQKNYDAVFIQSLLGETIKAVTLEYLKNGDLLDNSSKEMSGSTAYTEENKKPMSQAHSAPLISSEKSRNEVLMKQGQIETRQTTSTTTTTTVQEISNTRDDGNIKECPVEPKPSSINMLDKGESCKPKLLPSKGDSTADTNDSDDVCYPVSEKLQTVLLHISKSQTRYSVQSNSSHTLPRPCTRDPLQFPPHIFCFKDRQCAPTAKLKPPPPPLFDEQEIEDDWLN